MTMMRKHMCPMLRYLPLLATESQFAKNTFIPLTLKIATIHYNNKE